MSVLIKGLTKEKVERCFVFAKDGWCIFDMPEIIEVPKHGDLIDRDMVLEKAWDVETFVDAVKYAPTIIPAEEDGAD